MYSEKIHHSSSDAKRLTCAQKLVEVSVVYHMEQQNRN